MESHSSTKRRAENSEAGHLQKRSPVEKFGTGWDSSDYVLLFVRGKGVKAVHCYRTVMAIHSSCFRNRLQNSLKNEGPDYFQMESNSDYEAMIKILKITYLVEPDINAVREQPSALCIKHILRIADKYGFLRIRDMCLFNIVHFMHERSALDMAILLELENEKTLLLEKMDYEDISEITAHMAQHLSFKYLKLFTAQQMNP